MGPSLCEAAAASMVSRSASSGWNTLSAGGGGFDPPAERAAIIEGAGLYRCHFRDQSRMGIQLKNSTSMKKLLLITTMAALFLTACNNKPQTTSAAASQSATSSKAPDGVQLKLQEYAGTSATNCGRVDVHAPEAQSKGAADCALQAGKAKHAFYISYDMPGMAVGVA